MSVGGSRRGGHRGHVSMSLKNVGVDRRQRHMRSLCSSECEKASEAGRLGLREDKAAA